MHHLIWTCRELICDVKNIMNPFLHEKKDSVNFIDSPKHFSVGFRPFHAAHMETGSMCECFALFFFLSKSGCVTHRLEFMRTPIWLGSCVSQEEQREEWLIGQRKNRRANEKEKQSETVRDTKRRRKKKEKKEKKATEQGRDRAVIGRWGWGWRGYAEQKTRDLSESTKSCIKTSLTAGLKGALYREGWLHRLKAMWLAIQNFSRDAGAGYCFPFEPTAGSAMAFEIKS